MNAKVKVEHAAIKPYSMLLSMGALCFTKIILLLAKIFLKKSTILQFSYLHSLEDFVFQEVDLTVVSYDNNTGLIVARTRVLTAYDIGIYNIGCFTSDEGIYTVKDVRSIRIVLFGPVNVKAVTPEKVKVQEGTKVRYDQRYVKSSKSEMCVKVQFHVKYFLAICAN